MNRSPPPFGVFAAPLFGVGVFLLGDLPGVFFPLKFTVDIFCGVLLALVALIAEQFTPELYDIDSFDALTLPLSVVVDAFIFFCHRGAGPLTSPSITNKLFISLKWLNWAILIFSCGNRRRFNRCLFDDELSFSENEEIVSSGISSLFSFVLSSNFLKMKLAVIFCRAQNQMEFLTYKGKLSMAKKL